MTGDDSDSTDRHIDETVSAFERDWESGRLEDVLAALPNLAAADRKTAVDRLVAIDLKRLWASGEQKPLEDYFSLLGERDDVIPKLVQLEWRLRREHGAADPVEFEARFPLQVSSMRRSGRRTPEGASQTSASQADLESLRPGESLIPGLRKTGDSLRPHASRPSASSSATSGPLHVTWRPLEPGETLGRFRIAGRLGGGGMGDVYRATDGALDREVAIKVPRLSPHDRDEILKRFLSEARVVAKLSHPNLCPIYEMGDQDGLRWFAMRYVAGENLADRLKTREAADEPYSSEEAVRVVAAIADAIQYAHESGVLHRDLKPGNIMFDPRSGDPIVMDFGLALPTQSTDTRLTGSGSAIGTPAYMPLEQANGDLKKIGPQSDVYSLGAVLYEMLAGRPPVRGSFAEMFAQLVEGKPTPPSRIRPISDPALDVICLKALAQKLETRYSSAGALADALRDWLAKKAKNPNALIFVDVGDKPRSKGAGKSSGPSVPGKSILAAGLSSVLPISVSGKRGLAPAGAEVAGGSGTESPSGVQGPSSLRRLPLSPPALIAGGLTLAAAVLIVAALFAFGGSGDTADGEIAEAASSPPKSGETFRPLSTAPTDDEPRPRPSSLSPAPARASAPNPPLSSPSGRATPAEELNAAPIFPTSLAPARSDFAGRRAGEVRTIGSPPITFCWCPAGTVKLEDPADDPSRRVAAFWLAAHEVTQQEWRDVMQTEPWRGKADVIAGDRYPATYMSFAECEEFARRLTRRETTEGRIDANWQYAIPTEAEWEHACRAGTTSTYYFGEDENRLGEYAWYAGNSSGHPQEVGTLLPNRWNLYDMMGNVDEWCSDDYEHSRFDDASGSSSATLYRGGSYSALPSFCRSGFRGSWPVATAPHMGIRIAIVPTKSSPPAAMVEQPQSSPPSDTPSLPSVGPLSSDWTTIAASEGVALRLETTLRGHTGSVRQLAFSPDGTSLASGAYSVQIINNKFVAGNDNTVRIWDLKLGTESRMLPVGGRGVWALSYSPDGRQVEAACSFDFTHRYSFPRLLLWDTDTWTERSLYNGDGGHHFITAAFNPNGQYVSVQGYGPLETFSYSTVDGTTRTLPTAPEGTHPQVFARDGVHVLRRTANGVLFFWNIETGARGVDFVGLPARSDWAAVSPAMDRVAAWGPDELRGWNGNDGESLFAIPTTPENRPWVLSFLPTGDRFLVGWEDGTLTVHAADTGATVFFTQAHQKPIRGIGIDPSSNLIATGGDDSDIQIWRAEPAAASTMTATPNTPPPRLVEALATFKSHSATLWKEIADMYVGDLEQARRRNDGSFQFLLAESQGVASGGAYPARVKADIPLKKLRLGREVVEKEYVNAISAAGDDEATIQYLTRQLEQFRIAQGIRKGKHYAVIKERLPWAAAQKASIQLHGSLLKIADEEENEYVRTLLASQGVDEALIGASFKPSQTEWRWEDKSAMGYVNWEADSPAVDVGDAGSEAVGASISRSTGKWRDVRKGDSPETAYPFLCEF